MKMSKKNLMGLVLAVAIILFSGLAFSQDTFSPTTALKYFVSLYAPYEGTKTAKVSMCFGNELQHLATKAIKETIQMPKRTFLK